MKVKKISFYRNDLKKKNVEESIYNYDSVVNNDTGNTFEEIIGEVARILDTLFNQKEDGE